MVDLSSFSVFAEDRPDNGDKTEVVPVLDLSMDLHSWNNLNCSDPNICLKSFGNKIYHSICKRHISPYILSSEIEKLKALLPFLM